MVPNDIRSGFCFFLASVAYLIYDFYFGLEAGLLTFALGKGTLAVYFFAFTVELLLGIVRQVNLMIGRDNLWKLLVGKFYTPKEEQRIFMFIDLQSSTQLAEMLGHIRYSELIQDCFNDLGVIIEDEAQIHQYVGDEAVVTWNLDDGLRRGNCLNSFYRFKAQLEKNRDYYLQRYNCMPFFKAGMHAGVITVTEIGKYKKEIAYHGDTINTTARIQGKCNEFEQEFLISQELKELLKSKGPYEFKLMGSIPLRGKSTDVSIFAVTKGPA